MGRLPETRLKPATPPPPLFTYTILDLFGPYLVRGEVQKRASGKAYGVIFTDLVSRAVNSHRIGLWIRYNLVSHGPQSVCKYSWLAWIHLQWPRFTANRSRERAQRSLAENCSRRVAQKRLHKNGLTWIFGPADSPWHQGAVESLVKAAKRAIVFAISRFLSFWRCVQKLQTFSTKAHWNITITQFRPKCTHTE
jgi:hypothetical protein